MLVCIVLFSQLYRILKASHNFAKHFQLRIRSATHSYTSNQSKQMCHGSRMACKAIAWLGSDIYAMHLLCTPCVSRDKSKWLKDQRKYFLRFHILHRTESLTRILYLHKGYICMTLIHSYIIPQYSKKTKFLSISVTKNRSYFWRQRQLFSCRNVTLIY